MTIKEMRSAVCKKANEQIRKGVKKSNAFKWAWDRVKKEAKMIKVTDLKAGDRIRIEYGDYDNYIICTIIAVHPFSAKSVSIEAERNDGRKFKFCSRVSDMCEKAA